MRFAMFSAFAFCLSLVALACAPRTHEDTATATVTTPLSFSAPRVYVISAANYGQAWCPHGTVATDAAPRCNEPTGTVLARFPISYDSNNDGAPDACQPRSASLTLQRTEWSSAASVDVRRILRPVLDPPAGIAAACAPPGVAAWDSSGVELWTVPGAQGFGSDASTERFTFGVEPNGTSLVTVDLTTRDAAGQPVSTLVDACAPTGECVLGLYATAHVWEHPGSFTLFVDCASPIGGDGGAGGSSSSGTGGSSTTSTTSNGGTGGSSTTSTGASCS